MKKNVGEEPIIFMDFNQSWLSTYFLIIFGKTPTFDFDSF